MIRQIINRKDEGTADIFICLVIIVCLLMVTLYSIQLRIAQNEKYETDAAVIMAAESTLLMDLYQMSSTGESVCWIAPEMLIQTDFMRIRLKQPDRLVR